MRRRSRPTVRTDKRGTQIALIAVMGIMLVVVILFRDNVASGISSLVGTFSPPTPDVADAGEAQPNRLVVGHDGDETTAPPNETGNEDAGAP